MSPLAGPLHRKLQDAILERFDANELSRLVRGRLNVVLARVVNPGNFDSQVFDLVEWCGRQGRTADLLDALAAERPEDAALRAVLDEVRGGPPPAAPATPATPAAPAPMTPAAAPAADRVLVLIFASHPDGMTVRAADVEARDIEAKIRAAQFRDVLQLTTRFAARPDDLLQSLNQDQPAIVHFASLGSTAGEIILQDDDRQPRPVKPAALAALFRVLRGSIRVVFLSGCYSQAQAQAIAQHIDCVVGVGPEVPCDAARTFAASFYRALGFGRSVQEAYDQGKVALMFLGNIDEGAAHLLSRSGVDPAAVFLVLPPGVASPAPAPPPPAPVPAPQPVQPTAGSELLDPDDYVEVLRQLLPAHFALVVSRLKIGTGVLHGPQAVQAIDLVTWADQTGKLPQLHQAIDKYAPGALARRPTP